MRDVLAAVTAATGAVVEALGGCDLRAPSELPGWSRLTIACHLRYGADAMRWMTLDTVAGRPTAYYPAGRAGQRPGTLEPHPDESPAAVVRSLRDASAALDETWAAVTDWSITLTEPPDNVDLGPFSLAHLPLFRLTEVEVHGTDLGVGLGPWSDVLVEHATPMRLERLAQRTPQGPGAWHLVATDAPLEIVVGDSSPPERIDATRRDLFALTLGRIELSESFRRAYPGP